jgi:hypothetical protein
LAGAEEPTRWNEWYVPKFGPRRFRLLVGMSFLPYTLMNVSYVVIGSLLAPQVRWGSALALALVYLLGVGITAHALDAMGSNRPWGNLPRGRLALLAAGALIPALGIGAVYALLYAPYLLIVGVIELFFLFAYNLELFDGVFHSKAWFAFSWGFLPVLAGYVVQTNSVSTVAFVGGLFGYTTAYIEASASRPYKALKRLATGADSELAKHLEFTLKCVVGIVVSVALFLVLIHLFSL